MQLSQHEVLVGITVVGTGAILVLWTRWTERNDHISTTRVPWREVMRAKSLSTIGLARLLEELSIAINTLRLLAEAHRDSLALRSRKNRPPEKRKESSMFDDKITRFWALAGFLFDHKTRQKVYDISLDQIRADYLVARRECKSTASLRWVKTCLTIRGAATFLYCLTTILWRPISALIPEGLKRLWKFLS